MSIEQPGPQIGAETENPAPTESVAASIAAMAAVMERTRRDEARTRFWSALRTWFWRGLVALLLLAALVGSAIDANTVLGDQIARYDVEGLITDDPDRDALLAKIAKEDHVKALIVRINSPGGTTTGGEALYQSLRGVAEKKPVVAVMGEVAASAGYITALAADHVVARGNTITASVGVIFTAPNFHELMQKVGISVVELKSGVNKAEPSPYKPVDPEALVLERELVDDSFEWFLGLVKERRDPSAATLGRIRDGRVLTGRMAKEEGLVDVIGGQDAAVAWLESERGVAKDLPVVERTVKKPETGLFGQLVEGAIGGAGGLFEGGAVGAKMERVLGGPALLSVID